MERIRFNLPTVAGRELEYMADAVAVGHLSSDGPFTTKVVDLLRDSHAAADVVLTTSCTAALEMSAMLLDLRPGDTVIVPSFTFVSTALAFAREGARIVFADIERDTLGVDPDHVAELMDESVRAVVAVHYAGIGCQVDRLRGVLRQHTGVDLIEDNAHGLFGALGDRPLGSFGRFSTLSFHETKNFICGEGGALVLNDGRDVDRAHVVLDKGTNRRAFMLGQVDKYSWVDIGSSFGLSELLAAYLLGQLEQRQTHPGEAPPCVRGVRPAARPRRRNGSASRFPGYRKTGPVRTTCTTSCSPTGSPVIEPCSSWVGATCTPPSTTCRCTRRWRVAVSPPGRPPVP